MNEMFSSFWDVSCFLILENQVFTPEIIKFLGAFPEEDDYPSSFYLPPYFFFLNLHIILAESIHYSLSTEIVIVKHCYFSVTCSLLNHFNTQAEYQTNLGSEWSDTRGYLPLNWFVAHTKVSTILRAFVSPDNLMALMKWHLISNFRNSST